MAALGTLYTPTDALDFHRRLLPEVFGTVGRTPMGMTAAAREQRKLGDGQVWPQNPRNARGARKVPPTWLLASLAGLLGASGRRSPPGNLRTLSCHFLACTLLAETGCH
jgi:hypothetical protein